MSKRNVVKGLGGIFGNWGGVKAFPVCRVCDEIMAFSISEPTYFEGMSPRNKQIMIAIFIGLPALVGIAGLMALS